MEIQRFYIGKISRDVYTVKGKYESRDYGAGWVSGTVF